VTVGDELSEWYLRPAVAVRAVRSELVLVLVQAGEGAEGDH
jgi:hypothetical protein